MFSRGRHVACMTSTYSQQGKLSHTFPKKEKPFPQFCNVANSGENIKNRFRKTTY